MPEVGAITPARAREARAGAVPASVLVAAVVLVLIALASGLYAATGSDLHNRTDLLARLSAPGTPSTWIGVHLAGTDELGRDVLLRSLMGSAISFGVALAGVLGGCLIGILIGIFSGYRGGWVDRGLMVVVDAQLALPNLLLILCGIALLGTSVWVLIAMISLSRWETYARLTRSLVLSARERDYVDAVRAIGGGTLRTVFVHILPNIASPLWVMLTLSFPAVMLTEAGLSFLGVGVQPPTPSLGRMVAEGRNQLITAPWVALVPALFIVMITLSVQLIGDWLRDRTDVRARV
jgi:peptide/nickel transport system permease protein